MGHMISKTSYLAGCQCSKLLWMRLNQPDAFPPVDPGKQAIFDQGHAVGALAKTLYPGGIEVGDGVVHRKSVVEETTALLPRRVPLYEPAFAAGDGYARIDILVPDPDRGPDAWRIVEVKSGSSVKDENLTDVAFQLHVCRGAGLTMGRCSLMHVNSDYVRRGEVDPVGLLVEKDVTESVLELLPEIPARLAELSATAALAECPAVAIGPHCDKPYSCDLKPACWAFLPEYPVIDLTGDRRGLRWDLLDSGILALQDIPDHAGLTASLQAGGRTHPACPLPHPAEGLHSPGAPKRDLTSPPDTFILTPKQQIQVETARSGSARIDREAIRRFLDKLEWPLAYFDIETTSSAVPLYDGTRPFQQIPFQFSLHVQDRPGGPLAHHEFLAAGQGDPRPAFLQALSDCLPATGSVVAYNAPFENRCLRECADAFPGHAWAAEVSARTVDLLEPFRAFAWHHSAQHGSASIKSVLPALTGAGYSHLAIQDGNAAARAFAAAEFGNLPTADRDQLRADLLAYCALDTRAMVELVESLASLAAAVRTP